MKPPAPEPKATPEPEPEPAEPSTPSPSSTPSEAPPVDPSESRTIAFSLQILNDRGRSIPNLDVVLSPHTSTDASDTAPTASLQGRSDASGRVTFVEPVTPGEWDLELPDGLRKLDPLGPIVVDDVSDPQATTVVVDASNRARRIAGRVWTSTSTPAIGAVVEALDVEGAHRAHAIADDRGHFELYCEEGALTPVRLSVGPLPGHSPWSEERVIAWGTRGLELRLAPANAVVLDVRDSTTGHAVEDVDLHWYVDALDGSPLATGPIVRGPHGDGIARLEAPPTGALRLVVAPRDPRLTISDPIDVRHETGETRVEVMLERSRELRVRVRHRDGRAAAGSSVQWVEHSPSTTIDEHTALLPPLERAQLAHATTRPVLVDEAEIGPEGEVLLRGPVPTDTVTLRVLGDDHVPLVVHDVTLDGAVDLTVSAGTFFHGHVEPVSVIAAWLTADGVDASTLVLTSDAARSVQSAVEVAADGSFEIRGLDAGTWNIGFHFSTIDSGRGDSLPHLDLGAVELGDGMTVERRLDISALTPARLEGTVTLDDHPLERTEFELVRLNSNVLTPARILDRTACVTDIDGRFQASHLPPGRYRVVSGDDVEWHSMDAIDLAPGSARQVDFAIHRETLQLSVTRPDGSALAGAQIRLTSPETGSSVEFTTSDTGALPARKLSVGRYEVEFLGTDTSGTLLGEVLLTTGLGTLPSTMVVPD